MPPTGKLQVVAIGQVPPPVTGQAIMIEMLVGASFPHIEITHVPMVLSDEVSSQGKFAVGKLLRLAGVPFAAIWARLRTGARVLYYPPSGPVKLAVLRDVFVLLLVRPFFARTVLHFHAGGMSRVYPTLPGPIRALYRRALQSPDLIIGISPSAPSEKNHLEARREVFVPNGIEDPAPGIERQLRAPDVPVRILFVGHLMEGKGILILLQALALLVASESNVELVCIGKWSSDEVQTAAREIISAHGLESRVSFPGGLTGDPKWDHFRNADIFCFPSFFHSEVFPLVLLEAMAFALPVVSTRWRGIPDVVSENENALLVPPEDAAACAQALETLIQNPRLRQTFGLASRARFLDRFRSDVHLAAMERALLSAAGH